ncbi:hypothetical protein D3C80_1570800 [compost metagenome]
MAVEPGTQRLRGLLRGQAMEQAQRQQQGEKSGPGQAPGQQFGRVGAEQPGQQPRQQVIDTAQARAHSSVLGFAPEHEGLRVAGYFGVAHSV